MSVSFAGVDCPARLTHGRFVGRAKPTDYAGATGRIDLPRVARLGVRYRLQPKIDGMYCEVRTDADGAVADLRSRAGHAFGPVAAGDLVGTPIGIPHALLVGELEAGTAWAERPGSRRRVHLFDALRLDGRPLTAEPQYARRRALLEAVGQAESEVSRDRYGRAREADTGRYNARCIDRLPVVPERLPGRADAAWADWVADEGHEGLVVVAADAPVGARSAKRKCKQVEHLDCTVLEMESRVVRVGLGGIPPFILGRGRHQLRRGDVVEVAHEGFYPSGQPRFARIRRVRYDLAV